MADNDHDDPSQQERKSPGRFTGPGLVVPLLILAIIAGYLYLLGSTPRKITYDQFVQQLRAKNVADVDLFTRYAIGEFKHPVRNSQASKREGEAAAEPAQNSKNQIPNSKSSEDESAAEPKSAPESQSKKSAAESNPK